MFSFKVLSRVVWLVCPSVASLPSTPSLNLQNHILWYTIDALTTWHKSLSSVTASTATHHAPPQTHRYNPYRRRYCHLRRQACTRSSHSPRTAKDREYGIEYRLKIANGRQITRKDERRKTGNGWKKLGRRSSLMCERVHMKFGLDQDSATNKSSDESIT